MVEEEEKEEGGGKKEIALWHADRKMSDRSPQLAWLSIMALVLCGDLVLRRNEKQKKGGWIYLRRGNTIWQWENISWRRCMGKRCMCEWKVGWVLDRGAMLVFVVHQNIENQ